MTEMSNESRRRQQIEWNRQTATAWERWSEHRATIVSLLWAAAERASDSTGGYTNGGPLRLAVLGAGNGNDLDLKRLRTRFDRIDLIDWDREAVVAGVERQGVASDPAVVIEAPVDIGQPNCDPPHADVVASLGLLSQQMIGIDEKNVEAAGDVSTSWQGQAIAAAGSRRKQHVDAMLQRLRPGGQAILTAELMSSETLPELALCSSAEVASLAMAALAAGNFYSGMHPAAIRHTLDSFAKQGRLTEIRLSQPWTWPFGPRTYAVIAFSFRKAA